METSLDLLESDLAFLTDTGTIKLLTDGETSSGFEECALAWLTDTGTSSDLGEFAGISSDWGECALALLTDSGTAELLVDTETSCGLEE